MVNIDEFYREDCDKIDASCINAYVSLKQDDRNPAILKIDSSWGEDEGVDISGAVKAGETLTELSLGDGALCYKAEDGLMDTITGDALSRIISLSKLKDVDQRTQPSNGDVLMYQNGMWIPFDLTGALNQISNRIAAIERVIAKPVGIPDNAVIAWGNINILSDYTNTNKTTSGIYTHNVAASVPNDEYFA